MNKEILSLKESTVSEINESFSNAKSVTVVEYRGLTVAKLEGLRKTLRDCGAEMKIYKNTLVNLAATKLGYEELSSHLQGPNAFIFSNNDEVSAPKALVKFAKANEELVLKCGVVDGKVYDANGMKTIASLPGKDGLLSMFLSCLKAPVQKFAATLKAVADAKQ